MRKVVDITPKDNYCLLVQFDNGEKRIYNAAPLLTKPIFSILKDTAVFQSAYIECGAVTWKDYNGNEIDICPDKMYMDSV